MKPNFKSGTLFGPNLMGCEMGKIKIVASKPVYPYMKCKYAGDKLELC